MPFQHTLAGTTFTEANFEGTAYANEQTGFPKALEKIVEHVANAYRSPSTSSLTVGVGPRNLVIEKFRPFAIGQPVRIARTSDPVNVFMDGSVTVYDESTGAMTVEVVAVRGAATSASDWTISVGGVSQTAVATSPLPLIDGGTGATDAADARLNLGLGNDAAGRANLGLGDLATLSSPLPTANGGTGAVDAATARNNLGLGNVSTDDVVPLGRGGTGGTTAATARTNLGLSTVATDNVVPLARGGTAGTRRRIPPWRSATAAPVLSLDRVGLVHRLDSPEHPFQDQCRGQGRDGRGIGLCLSQLGPRQLITPGGSPWPTRFSGAPASASRAPPRAPTASPGTWRSRRVRPSS